MEGLPMSDRFRATLRDFWQAVRWVKETPEASEKVKKLITNAMWVLGPTGIVGLVAPLFGVEGARKLLPYAAALVVALLMYLEWHVAIAWHKNAGPVIWIGPPLE